MKITRLALISALVLMAPSTNSSRPDPAAPSAEYRQQVATSIQHLASHQRPREPRMSEVGTGRLVLEGVVENLRIYRLHQEEKARKAKEMGKDDQRGSKRSERYGMGQSSERRLGDDDDRRRRHRRRRRHSSDGDDHRSQTGRNRSGRDFGSRSDRTDLGRSEQHRHRSGSGGEPQPRRGEHFMTGALPAEAVTAATVARKVERRLCGPDGTPFGYLPTRDKGVGFLAHAKTTYQHIKAEQDAGHRSKGPAEKLIHGWLKKRKNAKSAANGTVEEEQLLIEKNTSSHGDRSERRGHRRKRRRSRIEGGNGNAVRGSRPVFVPVVERGVGSLTSTEPRGLSEQPEPSVRRPTVSRPPSRPPSIAHGFYDRDVAPDSGPEKIHIGKNSTRAGSVHDRTPIPPAPARILAPSGISGLLVRDFDLNSVRSSRSGSRAPTIRVQSSTPPVAATSYPITPSVVNMPAPVVANTPAIPPPPPLPAPAPVKQPVLDPGRDAFLTSVQTGVKPKKVRDKDKKDRSVARQDEAHIGEVTMQAALYGETPHSRNVEALEHAQAVEEKERRQVEKHVNRSNTPFIAPHPRVQLPGNFQDELTAKLGKMKLDKSGSEAASSVSLNVVRPRASNETWRTVYSEQAEENRMPNQQFRQDLIDQLSAKGTPRPAAAMTPTYAPSRVETPAPDVFVNLSAIVTEPGWSFGNVEKSGKA